MRRAWRIFWGLTGIAILAGLLIALLNFRAIDDWWKLRGYTPPPAIAKLVAEDTMTAEAKHIFYVNHPDLINNAEDFRRACPTYEQTIVIGCYTSDQNGIYLYSVQDPRLNGVLEVTAAHEMLHSAYDRLSQKDKENVDSMINQYYSHDLHDKRILDTIEAYKKTEPKDIVNEMHSIFGTEVNNLTPQLETYYKRYFTNRSVVVAFSNDYEAEFTDRQQQIRSLEQQLNTLKNQISALEDSLNAQLVQIKADKRKLDSLRASGQTAEYNAAVPGFNAEVDTYNAGVARLKDAINQYNELVATHNQLAAELSSLYSSINTNLAPQTAQ